MSQPSQLVVGVGDVGRALLSRFNAHERQHGIGHDPAQGLVAEGTGYAVMHICLPWQIPDFVGTVQGYQATFAPALSIVHSTVPIGTTAQIPGAVHSPVLGRSATMADDLVRFQKWVGGPRAADAVTALRAYGIPARAVAQSEWTEALKLLCLTHYGAELAMAHLAQTVLEKVGADEGAYELWCDWIKTHNQVVERQFKRPMLWPTSERIGGHCVIPGVDLLAQDVAHELLDAVRRYR